MNRSVLNTSARALVLVSAFIAITRSAHTAEKLGFKLRAAFWFAWQAFYPETTVWSAARR